MPWYRLKSEVMTGKDLPTLALHIEPGEVREVPAELTDPDFEPVPDPHAKTKAPKGGDE